MRFEDILEGPEYQAFKQQVVKAKAEMDQPPSQHCLCHVFQAAHIHTWL